MPQQNVDLIVVIPVGPTCVMEFILDTIDSVQAYTTPSRRIILVDDSQQGRGKEIAAQVPAETVDVVVTSKRMGHGGGLYLSLSLAYAFALRHYRFRALLRLDTDALVIGPQPEQVAIEMFRHDPRLAIGGWTLIGNQTLAAHFAELIAARALRQHLWLLLKRPYSLARLRYLRGNLFLRKLYRRAARNGFTGADYVFGGAYFMSEPYLRKLKQRGWLGNTYLGDLDLEEDHIFGLLAKALDMEIADMASGELPFACEWKSLPASPEALVTGHKKVAHSTRRWQDMNESDVRTFFLSQRREKQQS